MDAIQNFVGSNNINLLQPNGQFGTRLQGGKDAASPRYIFTKLAEITRYIFPKSDDDILEYLEDDGLLVLEVGNSGEHLEQFYPGVDFNWVEFNRGGHGVLVMSKVELELYADQLSLPPEPL